jgi:hypothetical protein
MFRFLNRSKKPRSNGEYKTEFRRLSEALWNQFTIGDTPFEELVEAMSAVDNELNRNGGGNWNLGDYSEYLDTIERHLLPDPQFTPVELTGIRWAVGEIAACGRELDEIGESSRSVERPIDCLIARVVDWCWTHPQNAENDS